MHERHGERTTLESCHTDDASRGVEEVTRDVPARVRVMGGGGVVEPENMSNGDGDGQEHSPKRGNERTGGVGAAMGQGAGRSTVGIRAREH